MTTIYLKGANGNPIPVEIETDKQPGVILASAEASRITALDLGKQMMLRNTERIFYVWHEEDYVFAYSRPDGHPPPWRAERC
jgi:hypothetical protein